MACENCRAKKIRCDSAKPTCKYCDQRSLSCVYINERQKRRRLSGTEIESRFRQLEDLVGQRIGSRHANITTFDNGGLDGQGGAHSTHREDISTRYSSHALSATPPQSPVHARCPLSGETENCHDPALWLRLRDGDEYTGPSSGISLLSAQGLGWIQMTLGEKHCLPLSTFDDLRKNVLNHLRIPKCIVGDPWSSSTQESGRTPLPGPAEIWQYVDAYFDDVQTIFPILDRQQFVRRATRYLASPYEDNSSWYALFSAVLASGCRAALATESPEGFSESGRVAWGYFKNALAMESILVHKATDLTAVQAFAVMTVYAQGMSSPQRLEYTLCSIATRLAQSLGMHRRPTEEWMLDVREQNERNRTFWIIYCLDKTIALRCGRPCTLDDDDISCELPQVPDRDKVLPSLQNVAKFPRTNLRSFDFLKAYTELARIHGAVAKRLYSARALDAALDSLNDVARALLQDLETWRISISNVVRPGSPFRPSTLAGVLSLEAGLALHFGYYDIICAVNRRFAARFQRGDGVQHYGFSEGVSTHIEAAKQMILLTKHLDTQSFTPGWLLFYYPMTALLTVFEHVISDSAKSSAKNDIALMEVVVGFFGRLEYLTSGIAAFNKSAEVVKQARIAVEQTSRDEGPSTSPVVENTVPAIDRVSWARASTISAQPGLVRHSTHEQTNNNDSTSGPPPDLDTSRGGLDCFIDVNNDMSTWQATWNPPLGDVFEYGETPSAWT